MPNKRAHQLFGFALGFITGLLLYTGFSSVMLFTACSFMTSRLPDYIEKPRDKYHRGFFHSKKFFIIIFLSFIAASISPLSGLLLGYLSHLLLDSSGLSY